MQEFKPFDCHSSLDLDLAKLVPIDGTSVCYDADSESVILSSDSQRLELSARSLDRTLIRNALLCFHFLNTTDSDYINSAQAKHMIACMQDEDPQLYEILREVVQLTFEYSGEESEVWKDDFLIRLRNYIATLDKDEATPLVCMQNHENALARYFDNLAQPQASDAPQDEVYVDSDGVECTFTPKINKSHLPQNRHSQLDAEVASEHKFGSMLNKTRSRNQFSEFIIFNFGHHPQWDATLRQLQVAD